MKHDRLAMASLAADVAPACEAWSLRTVDEQDETIQVRQDICEPVGRRQDRGLMVMVSDRGGTAYVATQRHDREGLRAAFLRAREQARAVGAAMPMADRPGRGRRPARLRRDGPEGRALPSTLAERIELVTEACRSLAVDPRIAERRAVVSFTTAALGYVDSDGAEVEQYFRYTVPNLAAVAAHAGVTQTRTLAGQYNGYCHQGGFEVLRDSGFTGEGGRIGREAVELALAPPCPTGTMDLVLMPDQMMLQIHESIGHPLELDRILGDERNFAGTSFVTPAMFGHYRYGSALLNVCHDPDDPVQFASFAVDDEGTASGRIMLIENGILKQPLGGTTSLARWQAREAERLTADRTGAADPAGPAGPTDPAGSAGRSEPIGADWRPVATTRASSWNRAPIDRMSNLNIEPGDSTLAAMIEATTLGVVMQTNCSWSIDDSRNKFQFGCEHGRMIRNGRLAETVRNPNYRGISATFWRALVQVGNRATREVLGTPFCGKGEPAQIIRVGHASPACRFAGVAVFGAG